MKNNNDKIIRAKVEGVWKSSAGICIGALSCNSVRCVLVVPADETTIEELSESILFEWCWFTINDEHKQGDLFVARCSLIEFSDNTTQH